MENIRPVSDLRNKYHEIEKALKECGAIYLTKNGYGTAVLVDIDEYERLAGKPMPEFKPEASPAEHRGSLHKLANPDLIGQESSAAALHALEKYDRKEVTP